MVSVYLPLEGCCSTVERYLRLFSNKTPPSGSLIFPLSLFRLHGIARGAAMPSRALTKSTVEVKPFPVDHYDRNALECTGMVQSAFLEG